MVIAEMRRGWKDSGLRRGKGRSSKIQLLWLILHDGVIKFNLSFPIIKFTCHLQAASWLCELYSDFWLVLGYFISLNK